MLRPEDIKHDDILSNSGAIFRVNEILVYYNDSSRDIKIYSSSNINHLLKDFYITRVGWFLNEFVHYATEEEKIWFEYCETIGEYRTKEEALDHTYAKQFVEQYLTEE